MLMDSSPLLRFLLADEQVLTMFDGVSLLNTNDDGILVVTNFQFLFVSKGEKNKLGTIPLTTIAKIEHITVPLQGKIQQSSQPRQAVRSIQVTGYDSRILMFTVKSNHNNQGTVFECLRKYAKPAGLRGLFAFQNLSVPPAVDNRISPEFRLLKEYHRLFRKWFSHSPSTSFEIQKVLENKWWRVTNINSDYSLCQTYPTHLIVPQTISDEVLKGASKSRKKMRLPAISWCDSGSGAVLARSSQPIAMMDHKEDVKLVDAFRTQMTNTDRRKLYIVDCRPWTSAQANKLTLGGTESASTYEEAEIVFLGILNIHEIRGSFTDLQKYVNAYESISSSGLPLGGSVLGDPKNHQSTINKRIGSPNALQKWLNYIRSILVGASWITEKIAQESASVLVHCSDGWDRTTQLVGLASIMLDPYYRTFSGFQAVVEKDWLAFGHQFAKRMGLPTLGEKEQPNELEISPILLQWLECIAHLMRMYPSAFEFSSIFLVDFMDAALSCRFGNFLCNSEEERARADVVNSCPCIWEHLADMRASGGMVDKHMNTFYNPSKYTGAIVPPAPALTPILWPEFYLRWTCPLESQRESDYVEALKSKKDAEPRSTVAELEGSHTYVAKPSGGNCRLRVVGSNVLM